MRGFVSMAYLVGGSLRLDTPCPFSHFHCIRGRAAFSEEDSKVVAKSCKIELPEIAWRPMPCDDFLSVFRFHLHLLYLRRLRNEA